MFSVNNFPKCICSKIKGYIKMYYFMIKPHLNLRQNKDVINEKHVLITIIKWEAAQ